VSFVHTGYFPQLGQTWWGIFGALQCRQIENCGSFTFRAIIRLPLRAVECFRFGNGAMCVLYKKKPDFAMEGKN